jgi:hypothetical protein
MQLLDILNAKPQIASTYKTRRLRAYAGYSKVVQASPKKPKPQNLVTSSQRHPSLLDARGSPLSFNRNTPLLSSQKCLPTSKAQILERRRLSSQAMQNMRLGAKVPPTNLI